MENQPINYREEITKALSFIPDAYLASLYHIIELIAKPFRKQEEEEKEEAQQQVTPEILQHYADTFRKGFKILMKEGLGLNVSYQIKKEYTLIKLTRTEIETEKREIIEEDFHLESLLKENELTICWEENQPNFKIINLEEDDFEHDYTEKTLLFDKEDNVCFLDISQPEKWTKEQATKDARDLLASMIKSLP